MAAQPHVKPCPDTVLVVDLDETLLRSDIMFETFWAAASDRWQNLPPIIRSMSKGKTGLKHKLQELGSVDVATLPVNESVLAYAKRWREKGGRTALVSAFDQSVVDQVAEHLGHFDEAHGSQATQALDGPQKATFLSERFPDGFAYVGASHADEAIWRKASHAITIDAPRSLQERLDARPATSEHLATRAPRAAAALRAMRPHQYLKNLLIFLPLLLAHQIDLVTLGQAALAFLAYSLVASSVYLLNDLLDLASDRAHPRKCRRPLASGSLPLKCGTAMVPALLLAGILCSLPLGVGFLGVMIVYYTLTTAYSFVIKRRLILDICTLAALYTMRIVAGGVATGINLSVWLLAFSMFFFFALAAVKRQTELVSSVTDGDEVMQGRGYRSDDLPLVANMAVASGYVSVLVMALYLNSPAVMILYSFTAPLWGICLILLYWISRMVMLSHRGEMHDDPVVFAARDRVSIICAGLILGLAVAAALF